MTTTTSIPQYAGNYSIEFDAEIGKFCCMHGVYEMWTTGTAPRLAQFKTLGGAMRFMAEEGIVLDEDENEIEVRPQSAQGATPDELAPLDEDETSEKWLEETAAVRDWNNLLQTPGYVERDLRDVAMFIETHADPLAGIQDDIRTGDIPLVPCEDRLIHSDDRPFCDDPDCPCRTDDELFNEYILEPVLAGLLTTAEALAVLWNDHI